MVSKGKIRQLLYSIYDIQEIALTSTIDGLLLKQAVFHCKEELEISILGYDDRVVNIVAGLYRGQGWEVTINRDNPENSYMEIK